MKKPLRLRQDQVWKQGENYLRIVRLERLEVEYKSATALFAERGTRHTVSKKEFCRLIKTATLLPTDDAGRRDVGATGPARPDLAAVTWPDVKK